MYGWRAQFENALRVLARISRAMDEAGHRPPILVGGAAVEIYTGGQVTTGDFDLSCGQMLGQARALYRLCEDLDMAYMERRISEETAGSHGLQDLADEA